MRVAKSEEARASLLQLVQEAPEAERAALAESVQSAADPQSWRTTVYQAVERADVARARDQVATAAARALTEAGCVVGEDFATVLASQEEAVAAFDGKPPGYGLLVRLPAEGARILAAVVRSDTAEQRDVEAQQGFCDTMLPALVSSLRAGGVRLDEQPFLQGYLPILQICLTQVYGFSGLYVDTAGAFVDADNVEAVEELANQEIR